MFLCGSNILELKVSNCTTTRFSKVEGKTKVTAYAMLRYEFKTVPVLRKYNAC